MGDTNFVFIKTKFFCDCVDCDIKGKESSPEGMITAAFCAVPVWGGWILEGVRGHCQLRTLKTCAQHKGDLFALEGERAGNKRPRQATEDEGKGKGT